MDPSEAEAKAAFIRKGIALSRQSAQLIKEQLGPEMSQHEKMMVASCELILKGCGDTPDRLAVLASTVLEFILAAHAPSPATFNTMVQASNRVFLTFRQLNLTGLECPENEVFCHLAQAYFPARQYPDNETIARIASTEIDSIAFMIHHSGAAAFTRFAHEAIAFLAEEARKGDDEGYAALLNTLTPRFDALARQAEAACVAYLEAARAKRAARKGKPQA